MASLIRAIVALSWPVVVMGPLGASRRGAVALVVLVVLAYGGGLAVGALQPLDPLHLAGWTGLSGSAGLLVAWAAFAAVARAAGPAKIPGTPLFGAVISGAILGELAAAAIVTAGTSDRTSAARLALAASAGGLIGRMGDPAMLLLAPREPDMLFTLVPMALLCTLVLFPGAPLTASEGRWSVTVVGGLTALGALLLGPHAWVAVLVGAVAMAAVAGAERLRGLDWTLPVKAALACALVIFAAAGGLPEAAATGIESIEHLLGGALKPALAAAAALLAVLSDSVGAALMADAVLDRGLALTVPGIASSMAAGIAVGGIGPLLVAGAVRAGALRWLAQIAIAVLWAALVL